MIGGNFLAFATAVAAGLALRRRAGNGNGAPRRSRRARVVRASASSDLGVKAKEVLLNNYGERSLTAAHGEGHRLTDVDGRTFLDFTSGIAVNCLGHSDPGWAAVVAEHAATLTHTSNMFLNKEQVDLAEKLVQNSFATKAFFANSGTEANEAAIKFSRKYHVFAGRPRERFVAFENSFHGRTMGSLALTWKQAYKKPFEPLMPAVDFLPYNEIEQLASIDESTCAVFLEPMQGEGGVIPASAEFLKAVRQRCDEVGALLVFDEVQCGLGRTGSLFAYQHTGVEPDLLTLAKPLAAGLPIGAVLLNDRVAPTIAPGDHGSTFAGAPLVCAAANYTVDRLRDPALLNNVKQMGERLREGLRNIVGPRGLEVRGMGLLCGVVFPDAEACGAVKKAVEDLGLLVLTAGKGNIMRIAPALTVGEAEIDEALDLLSQAFVVLENVEAKEAVLA